MLKRVLIIDDNINSCFGLRAKLNVDNFKAEVAETTNEEFILRDIEKIKPDIIILDVDLTHIDGYELLKKVKENKKNFTIIYSSLTNYIAEKCINLGADYCFSKNKVSLDELVIQLKKILKNKEKLK